MLRSTFRPTPAYAVRFPVFLIVFERPELTENVISFGDQNNNQKRKLGEKRSRASTCGHVNMAIVARFSLSRFEINERRCSLRTLLLRSDPHLSQRRYYFSLSLLYINNWHGEATYFEATRTVIPSNDRPSLHAR